MTRTTYIEAPMYANTNLNASFLSPVTGFMVSLTVPPTTEIIMMAAMRYREKGNKNHEWHLLLETGSVPCSSLPG